VWGQQSFWLNALAAVRGAVHGAAQSAPCALGRMCTPREVAKAVLAHTPALTVGSATRLAYCEAAVAVAFGESGDYDMATNKCPVSMPPASTRR
jgi:hypothetical protein